MIWAINEQSKQLRVQAVGGTPSRMHTPCLRYLPQSGLWVLRTRPAWSTGRRSFSLPAAPSPTLPVECVLGSPESRSQAGPFQSGVMNDE